MPELPEIETIKRGIAPYVEGKKIIQLQVRERRLRWPIPLNLETKVAGAYIRRISRRAKYLLFHLDEGKMILHLGMSGSLRVLPANTPPQKHDHVDFIMEDAYCLRLRDHRRFGALLWHPANAEAAHPLLQNIGPEPLGPDFDANVLMRAAKGRKIAIKTLIMEGKTVAGIGNIYASEALFVAKIHPQRPCRDVSPASYQTLVLAIQKILTQAITQGGTTLRDFSQADGKPGYFVNFLQVYGRTGAACPQCAAPIQMQLINKRASYFCNVCQT